MNETLKIEQAYYAALGIATIVKPLLDDGVAVHEVLVSSHGNEMSGVLFSSTEGFRIMQREEINVKFQSYGVIASHPDGTSPTSVYYGTEQWKSKLWVLNAAIVIAATDKLNRMKLGKL